MNMEGNLKNPLIWISAYMIYIVMHIRVGYMWEKTPLHERGVPHRALSNLTNSHFSA